MKPTGRLHIYPPAGPQTNGYIVADRQALRGLAEAAKNAADAGFGFETVKLYSSDGHEYELILISNVDEEEWQSIQPQYAKESVLKISTIQDYQELKQQLTRS